MFEKDEEYKLNVSDKVTKLKYKIKQWTPRHLTLEGKTLIVKTFGLSQLIYNMQCYGFELSDLKIAEKEIFNFLWSSSVDKKGVDRIKRTIMKNDYDQGGMKVTDVECLDRSLKLKQFVRADKSNHIIAQLQKLVTNKNGEKELLRQEYADITNNEPICQIAQETINIITDYNRGLYQELKQEEIEIDKNLIDEVTTINLKTYLTRKNRIFSLCILKPITQKGITTLGELIQNFEHEIDRNLNKSMKLILNTFPKHLINIANLYNENLNDDTPELKYLLTNDNRMAIETITVKDFQVILKKALGRTETTDFSNKLGIDGYDNTNITTFRKHCKNAKSRNIYFRLIHNDFYTHSRMKRYNMTQSDKCPRCDQTETTQHLLWECYQSKKIWDLFNEWVTGINKQEERVTEYKNVYKVGKSAGITQIKIKLIQEMIQIRRPENWVKENLLKLIKDLEKLDNYNSKKYHKSKDYEIKWSFLQNNRIM